MSNPILQQLNQVPAQMSGPTNPANMIQQFLQFRNQMQGRNPQKMVQDLLASGQMSQAQFGQLQNQAQNILNSFGLR